jgi:hypothetical protein
MTVFPPYLDYVFYRVQNEIKVLNALEVLEMLDSYIQDVPGFIKGTKVLPKKFMKKAHKAIKKHDFEKISHTFEKVDLKYLLDV